MKSWRYSKGVTAKTLTGKLEDHISLSNITRSPTKDSLARDQVIIRVLYATLNPADYKIPESDWFGRSFGLGNGAQPGMDFSGHVVAKHDSNTKYKEGNLVFGSLKKASQYGTLGEFTVASVSELAIVPEGVTPMEAAAIGMSAGTAWNSLVSLTRESGAHVFINGGSGGVGAYTIQLAKSMGAEVTATCSTRNVGLVSGLGADHVIDYKKTNLLEELQALGPQFDLVVDNVGEPHDLYHHSPGFLKVNGTFVQVAATPTATGTGQIFSNLIKSRLPGYRNFHFVTDKGKRVIPAETGN
ncbi:unnamed protein product [Parascedosporium putredinis]|uniref:Enoyl reductase (ER) domain-containing protein n=1 Tax=Parascedosporium putredinis TaxID=1442378 RepID=A0A9P1MA95_9PEZI|nr:unnamed protein product [Parascedosporium putredinis]CAI7997057.1 unnamed protein product [Parascedosporium putredinis]